PLAGDPNQRGQCPLHFKHFTNEVRHKRMTWEFLEQSGEALPKVYKENPRNANKPRSVSGDEGKGRTVRKATGRSNRSKKANPRNSKERVRSQNSRPSTTAPQKAKKGTKRK